MTQTALYARYRHVLRQFVKFGLVGYYWPKSFALPEIKPIIVNDNGASVASAV